MRWTAFFVFGATAAQLCAQTNYRAIVLQQTIRSSAVGTCISFGQIVAKGYGSGGSGPTRPLLWNNSFSEAAELQPTGYLDSETYVWAMHGGQQVGEAYVEATPANRSHALLWNGSAQSVVDLHPPGYSQTRAFAVHSGVQLGDGVRTALPYTIDFLLWRGTAASVTVLRPPTNFSVSSISSIAGDVMGGVGNPKPIPYGERMHALLFKRNATKVVDLHPAPLPGRQEAPYWATAVAAVNCSGVAVGSGSTPPKYDSALPWIAGGPIHALMWNGTASRYVDLNPPGFFLSAAEGISGRWQFGNGQRTNNGPTIGLVWSGTSESAIALDRFLPPGQWRSDVVAHGMDEFGNVVGVAFDLAASQYRAILWIPDYGNGAAPVLQIAPWCEAGGQVRLQLAGEAGREYSIEKSEDLVNWTTVLRTNIPTPLFYYQEPELERAQHRFFRATLFN